MKKLFMLAMLTLGVGSTAWAADRATLQVFNDVSKQVQRYAYFTVFDTVHASIKNGVVTLTGKVTLPYKATEIAKRVAKVDGVTQVNNRIQVLPVSQLDDNLRLRIARAIYAHPALSQYGLGPNPSIHVIVDHGRVTLDGVVNNDSDRTIARMVASQFQTFGLKNDLKTKDEVKEELEHL
jgi:hyperosmotically inducible protein